MNHNTSPETITKPDSLGLSYRVSADGNIDIAGYRKPRKTKLERELEQKECRCFLAAMEINKRGEFKATEDTDLCAVIIAIPNWDGLEVTIDPVETPEENLDGSVSMIPAWRLWIGEEEIGQGMSLPAAIAAIRKWIVLRDLDDETRVIFDTYQNQ